MGLILAEDFIYIFEILFDLWYCSIGMLTFYNMRHCMLEPDIRLELVWLDSMRLNYT